MCKHAWTGADVPVYVPVYGFTNSARKEQNFCGLLHGSRWAEVEAYNEIEESTGSDEDRGGLRVCGLGIDEGSACAGVDV